MLKLFKIKSQLVSIQPRKAFIGLFIITVFAGFSIPYFNFGANSTAGAASNVTAAATYVHAAPVTTVAGYQAVIGSSAINATAYTYKQLAAYDAYPLYITASFTVAAGLSLYALTYRPERSRERSRYPSRFTNFARTTY